MTNKEYLEAILESQKLSQDSEEYKELIAKRDEVEELLRNKFKDSNPTIRYGGSKAKNTMIRDSYDLDIICYFEHEDHKAGETLKDIYENVQNALKEKYMVEARTSSLRLLSSEKLTLGTPLHIDVVPGRYTNEDKDDAYLYYSKADKERIKTNLQKHIDHVKESGLKDIVKLIKLWKFKRDINVRTFILELLTIEILNDYEGTIDEKLLYLWEEIKDNIDNYNVEDPANANNDLSDLFDDKTKTTLSNAANSTLFDIDRYGWESVFGPIDDKEKEQSNNLSHSARLEVIEKVAAKIQRPTRPWRKKH